MEAHANGEAGREMLERGLAADQRRLVLGRGSRGEAALRDEVRLELLRIHAFAFGASRLLRRSAEHPGKLAIEVDQLLGDRLPFGRVGVQQRRRALALQNRRELPSQVEGVLHGHVHALPGLRAVGVTGVPGDEDAREAGFHLLLRHVVELVAQTLADLVDGPPGDVFDVQRVRMNDPVRGCDQLVGGDVLGRQVLIRVELVELDVEADQVAPLAGDDEDVPLVGG